MSRTLPDNVAQIVRLIPPEFAINYDDHGYYVRWAATLAVEGYGPVNVEIGYSKASGRADEESERATLRAGAWQAMELARLGRLDLLAYCMIDRHKRDVIKNMAR